MQLAAQRAVSLDDMARDSRLWPTLYELLLTEHVPGRRITELVQGHPAFARWVKQRRFEAKMARMHK